MIILTSALAFAPLGHDAGEVRRRAEDLLSHPPFTDGPPGPVRRALRAFGDALAQFLGDLFGDSLASGLLPWVVVVLGVIVVGWLVWRITRGLAVDRTIAVVPTEATSRSAGDWHADADAARARGDLREALRCRYGALVATLLAGGVLEDVPGRTVRELDREIARAVPAIADDVVDAGRAFEAAIYGRLEVDDLALQVVTRAAARADAALGRRTVTTSS